MFMIPLGEHSPFSGMDTLQMYEPDCRNLNGLQNAGWCTTMEHFVCGYLLTTLHTTIHAIMQPQMLH